MDVHARRVMIRMLIVDLQVLFRSAVDQQRHVEAARRVHEVRPDLHMHDLGDLVDERIQRLADDGDVFFRVFKLEQNDVLDHFNETWEKDFKPVELPDGEKKGPMPAALIMILDLYFRLTPSTMVVETPEIQEISRLLKMKPAEVVDVMEIYQFCDPYLKRRDFMMSPLLTPCQQVWQRFGNGNPQQLAALAAQLKNFFV